jgi:trimeric autotransporter adhesin
MWRVPLFVAAALAAVVPVARADTYTVDSTRDAVDADLTAPSCADSHGRCTLRAAVMQANASPGADLIILPAGTFRLRLAGIDDAARAGDLDVSDSLRIKGAGAARTVIDGNGTVTGDRVFQALPVPHMDVELDALTIRGGRSAGDGGGISWQGTSDGYLDLEGVVVESNRADAGGGIAVRYSDQGGSVRLNRVIARRNRASSGGGVAADLRSTLDNSLIVTRSRVQENHAAHGTGGGIAYTGLAGPEFPAVNLIDTTMITGNRARDGAGVWDAAPQSRLLLQTVTIGRNTASGLGGGVMSVGDLFIRYAAITRNTAHFGGGIFTADQGGTRVVESTVSDNVATRDGGGAVAEHGALRFSFANATIAGNRGASTGGIMVDAGVPVTVENVLLGHGKKGANCSRPVGGITSLSDDGSCGFGVGDSVALRLGPLGDHGGPTQTQVPGPGSPAVDAGTAIPPDQSDQRGDMPIPDPTDIGSVEVCKNPPEPPSGVSVTVRGRRAAITWYGIICVQTYGVRVRRGSPSGRTVGHVSHLNFSTFVIRLPRHEHYYVRVSVVADRGRSVSPWIRFRVP